MLAQRHSHRAHGPQAARPGLRPRACSSGGSRHCLFQIVSATCRHSERAQLYPIPAYAASYPFTYIQKQPYLGEADTNTEFLPWVSDKAILDLTRAAIEADRKNYTGAAAYTAAAAPEIQMMLAADAKVRGPQQIRMGALLHARHRLERTARYGRTHFR